MNKSEQAFHARLAEHLNTEGDDPGAVLTREQAAEAMTLFTASLVCHSCLGSGDAMCNRYFCGTECGVRISDNEGYCPDHQAAAGHPKRLRRENCEWSTFDATNDGRCLRRGCSIIVRHGARCLFFPERRRVIGRGLWRRVFADNGANDKCQKRR